MAGSLSVGRAALKVRHPLVGALAFAMPCRAVPYGRAVPCGRQGDHPGSGAEFSRRPGTATFFLASAATSSLSLLSLLLSLRRDKCYISKGYDATTHFETTVDDVLDMYHRVAGRDLDLTAKDPKEVRPGGGEGGVAPR